MNQGLFDLAPVVEREIENLDRIQAQIHGRAAQLASGSRHRFESLARLSERMSLPLNSMLQMAKRLADDDAEAPPARVDYARTIYSAGTQLRALIHHILDLARIESGDAALDIGAERFAELGKYLEQAYRDVALRAELEFDIELASDLPASIKTDGKRLRQILDNLLSNAFRFTRRGGVTLRIAPIERSVAPFGQPSDCGCKWVQFSVTDTGIGIARARQETVFEPLHGGDAESAPGSHGDGLGLFTCRQLAQILGGELHVVSSEGSGSCFTLLLPLAPRPRTCSKWLPQPGVLALSSHSALADKNMRTSKTREKGDLPQGGFTQSDKRVLVVSDDIQFASLMLGELDGHGCRGEAVIGLDKLDAAVDDMAPAALVIGLMNHESGCRTIFDLLRHGHVPSGLPIGMICRGRGEMHKCLQIGGRWCDRDLAAREPAAVLARMAAAAARHMSKVLIADGAESLRPDSGATWQGQGSEAVVFGTGALVADALRYGGFDGLVLGPTLMDMSVGELLKRLLETELPIDLPIAILGAGTEADTESVEIAMLKRRNGLAEALGDTDLFLRRAMQVVEVH